MLGSDQVKALAAKAGINPDVARAAIAQIAAGIVDKLTPNGSVPDHSNVHEHGRRVAEELGEGLLEGMFGEFDSR